LCSTSFLILIIASRPVPENPLLEIGLMMLRLK